MRKKHGISFQTILNNCRKWQEESNFLALFLQLLWQFLLFNAAIIISSLWRKKKQKSLCRTLIFYNSTFYEMKSGEAYFSSLPPLYRTLFARRRKKSIFRCVSQYVSDCCKMHTIKKWLMSVSDKTWYQLLPKNHVFVIKSDLPCWNFKDGWWMNAI